MRISEHLQREIAVPKRELDARLEEAGATAEFVSTAIVIRPRLNTMLDWTNLSTEERNLMQSFLQLRDTSSQPILGSILVICYGALEKFVEELIERAVWAINMGCNSVDDIPSPIVEENIFRTGQVLQLIRAQRVSKNYDYVGLAGNLGLCRSGETEVTLNAECFSYGHGILSSGNLEQVMGRVGIALSWDRFGSDPEIKETLGQQKTRECAKMVRKEIDDLVRTRNAVSHTGSLDAERRLDDVRKYVKLLPSFCTVLARDVGRQLDSRFGVGG